MDNNQKNNDTINLLELFYVLRERVFLILAVALLFACGAAGYSKYFMTPTYTSTSTILVISKETTLTSLADLQLGSQLTKDYTVLINSRPVLEQVIENLGLAKHQLACGSVEQRQRCKMIFLDMLTADNIKMPSCLFLLIDELTLLIRDEAFILRQLWKMRLSHANGKHKWF